MHPVPQLRILIIRCHGRIRDLLRICLQRHRGGNWRSGERACRGLSRLGRGMSHGAEHQEREVKLEGGEDGGVGVLKSYFERLSGSKDCLTSR
jgi:hypothetical protein